MSDYDVFTLNNGMRAVHALSYGGVAYCGLAVLAGSRDDGPEEQGMAHFVEHTIFKGTRKRKAWHILNRMENVGGDLNAFTNKEETVIYSTFLSEHAGRAMELLSDIVFHSVFPAKELEKEKCVIADEMNMYEDSPSELIYDDFEALLFKSHPLGRNILGTPSALASFTSEDALRFVSRYYSPSNMILFFKGNIDNKKVRSLASKHFEQIADRPVPRQSVALPCYEPFEETRMKALHQTHVMVGCRGYDAFDGRRTALCLLANILGGPGMNSRLNVELRERRGLVYSVEANMLSYRDSGVFSIAFASDNGDSGRCVDLVRRQIRQFRDKRMGSLALSMAKKQFIGQIAVASDNNENCALDMAKSFLHYGKVNPLEKTFAKIDAVTASDILEVANDKLQDNDLSVLAYVPAG